MANQEHSGTGEVPVASETEARRLWDRAERELDDAQARLLGCAAAAVVAPGDEAHLAALALAVGHVQALRHDQDAAGWFFREQDRTRATAYASRLQATGIRLTCAVCHVTTMDEREAFDAFGPSVCCGQPRLTMEHLHGEGLGLAALHDLDAEIAAEIRGLAPEIARTTSATREIDQNQGRVQDQPRQTLTGLADQLCGTSAAGGGAR